MDRNTALAAMAHTSVASLLERQTIPFFWPVEIQKWLLGLTDEEWYDFNKELNTRVSELLLSDARLHRDMVRRVLGDRRPSTDELLGIDPDYLGGQSVDEYIDEIRDRP
jgi:hypothetical protein